MLPKVAIVGRPNVGKSTLFNRIVGSRLSITDDAKGITRDRIYAKATWLSKSFNLIDTGGIEISDAPFLAEIKAQAQIAIDEADVILFVTECRSGLTDEDLVIAKMLYSVTKPIIPVVNKVDDQKFQDMIYEFYSLGLGDPYPVSGAHGIGLGDILDEVIKLLPTDKKDDMYPDDMIKFSIVGRPNVGKSSLFNVLTGKERVIVSPIEGTTRDAIDTILTYNKRKYVVIDTAGIRKSGKVYENAEKYSVIRALDAIDRSDIGLVLIDAEKGILEQDKHVAGYVKDAYKACLIVVNKWDLVEKDTKTMKKWIEEIRDNFQFINYAPIVFVSAKYNKRIQTIYEELDVLHRSFNMRISTGLLNQVVSDAVAMNPTPLTPRGKGKILYATQVETKPPTFVLFVNDEDLFHFSYIRYLENTLRKNFDLTGTPLKIILRNKDKGDL